MALKTLFPTKIWQGPLGTKAIIQRLNQELKQDTQAIMSIDRLGWNWSKDNYVGGYTSYSSMTKLHQRFAPFMELKKRIDRKVSSFVQAQEWEMQGRQLKMTDCWVNVMPSLVHHSLHLHPQSVISGTYYVALPKGSGILKFEDPRLGLFMAAPARKNPCSVGVAPFYGLRPKPGELVLWESWLRHEVTANAGNGERISISFNYS